MNVQQIRKLTKEYRFKSTNGLDALSVNVINAYRRTKVTEAEQLLTYIDAICVSSSKSSDLLFVKLCYQEYPDMEHWAENKFYISDNLKRYTDALYELYQFDMSGDGNRFTVVNDLNVYTKLFKISDDIYCTRSDLVLKKLRPVDVNYLRMLFGKDYIKSIVYPNDMCCAELAFAYKHPSYLVYENDDRLIKIVHECKQFTAPPDNHIIDYSSQTVNGGILVNMTVHNLEEFSSDAIVSVVETILSRKVTQCNVTVLNKYRIAVFVTHSKE